MKRRSFDLPLAWIATTALSIAVFLITVHAGEAADCKPGQSDGQCGLSTFTGVVEGAGAGLGLFVVGTVCILIVACRRRRKSRQTVEKG
ncbi:MAG TPA: hypothetical protein VGM27_15615 [Acidobacteriaceae bacterium]